MVLVISCTVGTQQLCGRTEAWIVEPGNGIVTEDKVHEVDGCRLSSKNSL